MTDKTAPGAKGAPFRVALIGYGVGGAVFHAPLVSAVKDLELAAIVTSSAQRVAQAKHDFPGAKILASAADLFSNAKDYDLAIVCSPNRYHFEQAKAAMEAGLHVVVDKPITVEAEQARELIDLSERHGKLLTAFQNRRLDGDFLTVKKIVQEKMLGKLVRFESRFERFRPEPKANAWREKGSKEDGGGLLFDLGSHLIDQVCHLFGPPLEIYCELDRRREGVETDDDCFIALKFTSGLRAHLYASVLCRIKGPRFKLLGSLGSFEKFGMDPQEDALRAGVRPGHLGWGEDKAEQYGHLLTEIGGITFDGNIETIRGAYEDFYQDVATCLQQRALGVEAHPAVAPQDALRTARIIEAAYKSASTRAVVPFTG